MKALSGIQNLRALVNIFLTVAIIIAIVYFAGRWSAKNKVAKPEKIPVPPDLDPNAGGNWNPGPVTDALYDEIYRWPVWTRDNKPFAVANALNDTRLAMVINDWNRRYFTKDKETLFEAIKGERDSLSFISDIANREFEGLKASLLTRIYKLENQ